MAGSPFFARIKADVLAIARAVPPGRVVAYADVGAHLDVMPCHVAYVLATLGPMERETVPWHRAVAADGTLGPARAGAAGAEQARLLAAEGVSVGPDGRIAAFAEARAEVADLPHGVPKQVRPPDAPAPTRRRR